MKEVVFNQLKIGMVIGKSIYVNDNLLFNEGTIIRPSTINLLRQRRIKKIAIYDSEEISKEVRQKIRTTFKESIEVSTGSILDKVKQGININKEIITGTVDQIFELIGLDSCAIRNLYYVSGGEGYLYSHSINTAILSILLSKKMGLDDEKILNIGMGALMHDVGMLNIPAYIYSKVEPLDDNEWEQVMLHPELGMNEVSKISNISPDIVNIVWQHQERMDGSGYPEGIMGSDISFEARLISICDIYEALTTKRSYRESHDVIDSLKLMVNDTNNKLDKEILQEFIKIIPIYPLNSIVVMSNGQRGIVIGTTKNPFRPLISLLDENGEDSGVEIDLSESKYFKMFVIDNIKKKGNEIV